MKIENLQAKMNREQVFRLIDCYEDSPVYEEVEESYEELEKEVMALIKPQGRMEFSALPAEAATKEYPEGTPVIFLIATVGREVTEYSDRLFKEGEYLKGMLVDAMADSCLFSLEPIWQEQVREACGDRNVGIARRLEAPQDLPMTAQKVAYDVLNAKEELDMKISSGYMYDPVKASCQVFVLTDDKETFRTQHNCRACPKLDCKMRSIPPVSVTVTEKGNTYTTDLGDRESLMDSLIRSGSYISAVCGGRGICGKCKIKVTKGYLSPADADRKFFTEEELKQGFRLACLAYPKEDLEITLDGNQDENFEVLSAFQNQEEHTAEENGTYGIAIDIGTTTIAVNLITVPGKAMKSSYSVINHQRAYGADVVSRMQAANEGKGEELRASIRKDLLEGIRFVIDQAEIEADQVVKIAIGGNTTMGHLLLGLSCESLGVYPFTPVDISYIEKSFEEVFADPMLNCPVVILPGISTFVGGDIVSGLLFCGFDQAENVCMLVDLGTNGEMAIGNKDKILVTSTAAGPAFEGGNISCGMGSVAGAICHVKLSEDGTAAVETIGDKPAIGLCGTGVIETTAELLRNGLVDETGLLDDDYFDDGILLAVSPEGKEITFTQKDVREIQLAKSAVRAGLETLILRYGVDYGKIDKVYLAGGFGYKIDQEKAVAIGMIPAELEAKIETVGNSSLGGAYAALGDPEAEAKLNRLVAISEEIGLSTDKDFNELYMEHMYFEEEE